MPVSDYAYIEDMGNTSGRSSHPNVPMADYHADGQGGMDQCLGQPVPVPALLDDVLGDLRPCPVRGPQERGPYTGDRCLRLPIGPTQN